MINAKMIIFITLDNLPGSVLTRARIIKYNVAAPSTKKTNTFIISRNPIKDQFDWKNKSTS